MLVAGVATVAQPHQVQAAGGAYTLNFAAADPSIYLPPIPFPGDFTADPVPGGRGDGSVLIPLADFDDGTSDVRVESLAPQDMALGQVVPFETKISVSGDVTPENGVVTFVIGWNTLTLTRPHPLFEGLATGPDGLHAYFVHSYFLDAQRESDVLATCDYGGPVTAAVVRGNRFGTQFHPEKSQRLGLGLIANFLRWAP